MNNKIFYFSATGNTLYLAKKIAKQISAELIAIKDNKNGYKIQKSDIIGIFSPVYAVGLPEIVEKFIKNLKIEDSSYNFLFLTHAGGPLGTQINSIPFFKKYTKKSLDAVFDLKMPANDIALFGTTNPENVKGIISQADAKLGEIINKIEQKQPQKPKKRIIAGPISQIVHQIFEHESKKAGKRFSVTDKCVSCGICEKICPMNNITLIKGKPVWESNCILCEACINWCPEKAIEKGNITKNRNRYTNPFIKKEELY